VIASREVGKGIRLAGPQVHNAVERAGQPTPGGVDAQALVDGVYQPWNTCEVFDVSDTKPAAFQLMALIGRIV